MNNTVNHMGLTITLQGDFTFRVSGEGWAEERSGPYQSLGSGPYQSLADAKNAIEGYFKRKRAQEKAVAKTVEPMLDEVGTPLTIRGFNSNTGLMLSDRKGYEGDYYPVHTTVRALLEERARLKSRIGEIDKSLSPVRVSYRVAYGRSTPEQYERRLADLLSGIRAAREAAEKIRDQRLTAALVDSAKAAREAVETTQEKGDA